jgi:hypothetical protein
MKNKTNKILNKNLKVLKEINSDLYKWMMNEKDIDWVQIINSENKQKNLLIESGSKKLPIYNIENPENEAKEAVSYMGLYKDTCSILVGSGLGYLAHVILNKMDKGHRLIVIEPVANMIKLALSNKDFSKNIKNGTLIIVAPGQNEVAMTLGVISNSFVIQDWNLTYEKYIQYRPNEYLVLSKFVSDCLNQILCNTGTVAGDAGGKIADNDVSCMPYVIRHRGVKELEGLYKDKPCILVSTGPSLQKNIHHLIDIQDKVVIICVGQALRILLSYSIRPDFFCTVDFGEVNMGHFKGLMDCDVPMVTINRTYAPLIQSYKGPKFIAATPVPGFEHMATGILSDKGFIDTGGSVAHMCLGLAKLLGCNPITFVGQDLALGETSHSPLADAGGDVFVNEDGQIAWKVKDQRCSLHNKGAVGMGPATPCPGYWGSDVITNLGLMSFKTSFETMIKQHLSE